MSPKPNLPLGDYSFNFYGLTVKCRVVAEREQQPAGIQVKNETASGKKDGALIGVTDKMEWSADGTTWNDPNQNASSNLAPGDSFVRTKSTDAKAASLPASFTIGSGGKLSVKFIYFDGTLAEDRACDYGEQITQTPALPAVNGYHDPSWDMLLPYTVRADEIRYASYQPNDGLQKADKPANISAQNESYPGARDGWLINLTNAMSGARTAARAGISHSGSPLITCPRANIWCARQATAAIIRERPPTRWWCMWNRTRHTPCWRRSRRTARP